MNTNASTDIMCYMTLFNNDFMDLSQALSSLGDYSKYIDMYLNLNVTHNTYIKTIDA